MSGGVLVGTEPRSPKTWKLKVTHHIKGIERKKWNTLQNIHGVLTLIKLLIVISRQCNSHHSSNGIFKG